MNKIPPSLNMLKPDMAFSLKWLSYDERNRLIRLVLDMSPSQYRLLKYGWGIGDGRKR